MSGEGLEVRRTKCPAKLKQISRTLPLVGDVKSLSSDYYES